MVIVGSRAFKCTLHVYIQRDVYCFKPMALFNIWITKTDGFGLELIDFF